MVSLHVLDNMRLEFGQMQTILTLVVVFFQAVVLIAVVGVDGQIRKPNPAQISLRVRLVDAGREKQLVEKKRVVRRGDGE